MANNHSETPSDDFLEQILGISPFGSAEQGLAGTDGGLAGAAAAAAHGQAPMMLQLSSGDGGGHISTIGSGSVGGAGFHGGTPFPLGLSLDQGKSGFLKAEEASGSGKRYCGEVVDVRASSVKNVSSRFSLLLLRIVKSMCW